MPTIQKAEKQSTSLFCAVGSKDTCLKEEDVRKHITSFLQEHGADKDSVMIIPPDFTRLHSQSGIITEMVTDHYNFPSCSEPSIDILPALGTHAPMTDTQIRTMFGEKLGDHAKDCFHVHDWRNDVETIGYVPSDMVATATRGKVLDKEWPAQLNKKVWALRNNPKALVLSIGQVVPHEVMGMANFNKNLFVGVGGVDAINISHFIGAVFGMESMMGRAQNPLRDILNYASDKFLHTNFENTLWYILTVMGRNNSTGELEMKGLYIGNGIECYDAACELSLQVNFTMLSKAPSLAVAYMDPSEFHSTWLGNKSIYRTRMAMADGSTLIVLAPGVKQFGEDEIVDKLIRKYGYVGTTAILKQLETSKELQDNLSAVAHLIHGSTEGRFNVIYCPGHLNKQEIEGVGFQYADLNEMLAKYDINTLRDGWNKDEEGNEFYYISNPALGLWAVPERFQS
mmetsp:Transcript_30719/g.45458  ORF Transcript_30719/g.45458 Transcript_30719/m.45458 type:complete len:455 (-) Transcript_30719:208-1572(-)|eukprot:CAMPEP_0194215368 /NCGR_PEP_ID=MMETSP0156-20130528/17135_1 /TAXON_ID=33649 /ORGANISM="Thalassionema nitzschioides, Strain L26-B" /LENGTH=454 /DNA_ID=CAMNT_0038943867 /DNA_START=56 /DNA_END=1420 /DNA_ORIENTATION=+